MGQTRVRRVPISSLPSTSEKWDEWLPPVFEKAKRLVSRHTPQLIRLGGIASILGGILWIVVLSLIQWDVLYYAPYIPGFLLYLFYDLFEVVLAIGMLLFLAGIIGLHLRFRRAGGTSRFACIGVLLAAIGLIMAVIGTTLGYYSWLYFDSASYAASLFNNSTNLDDPFNGMFTTIHSDWGFYHPIESWYNSAFMGLVALSIGLLLIGIHARRAKLLPFWMVTSLIVSSLAMHVVSLGVYLLVEPYEANELLYDTGLFALILALFGASWIWLGFLLPKKWQAKSDYMSWDTHRFA